jgi:hypothetical protein
MARKNLIRSAAWFVLFLAIVGALLLLWAKQRADMAALRAEYAQALRQNETLREELSRVPAGPAAPEPAAAQPRTAAPVAAVPAPPPTPPKRKPPATTLALSDAQARTTPQGLAATLTFTPSGDEPLAMLALVVRLPGGSMERIVALAPADATVYTDVNGRVSEDGRFAVFTGTPEKVGALRFTLSVSGPASPVIRGSCGIEPFELQIRPEGATPRVL